MEMIADGRPRTRSQVNLQPSNFAQGSIRLPLRQNANSNGARDASTRNPKYRSGNPEASYHAKTSSRQRSTTKNRKPVSKGGGAGQACSSPALARNGGGNSIASNRARDCDGRSQHRDLPQRDVVVSLLSVLECFSNLLRSCRIHLKQPGGRHVALRDGGRRQR
jgi:hypothetical protein